jgi:hypothetical protein
MKSQITSWTQEMTFRRLINKLDIQPSIKENEGMKFREWYHKIGGYQNFTEDQISIAVNNKFNQ